ncbi:hypothetical protein PIB30_061142 [Stylosanthes scabra]|uniref:Uncharacterized protein n=1 Tax=Stylosanthes scabra TaxID=79078 RepID=A0ABU6TL33_9FABA|nr:hypothetical protein [Stylosanthes scabra]
MKPRHLSEGLLPEDKHPSSGDCWTDNISEVYFSIWEGAEKVNDETTGKGVSSMSERLIDFKAQLTIQRNELPGLRNTFRGYPVMSP